MRLSIIAAPADIALMSDARTPDGVPVLHSEAIQDMIDALYEVSADGRPVMTGAETRQMIAVEHDDFAAFCHLAKFWSGESGSVVAWLADSGAWIAPEIPEIFTAKITRRKIPGIYLDFKFGPEWHDRA